MRSELGAGYANYTSDHFSNFSVSHYYVSGYETSSGKLYKCDYSYHEYIPSTGKLNIYIDGHTGGVGRITTVNVTINFTIIQLKQ